MVFAPETMLELGSAKPKSLMTVVQKLQLCPKNKLEWMFSPLSVFFAIFIIGSCQSLFARRYLLIKFMAFSLGPNHSTASYWRENNHVGKNASLLAIIILKDSEYGKQTWKSHVSMIAWSNSYLKVSTCSFISGLLF